MRNKITDSLKSYFDNTDKDEVLKQWNKHKDVGIKIIDYNIAAYLINSNNNLFSKKSIILQKTERIKNLLLIEL